MTSTHRGLEVKVGLFTLGALALLAAFFVVVGNPTFGPGVELKVDYAFTGPIKDGATVRISGVTVGKVRRVEFVGNRPPDAKADHPLVRLHLFVEQRAAPLLVKGTRFYVTTQGVMGEHYVDVAPGAADHVVLKDGDTVRGVDMPRTDLLMARMAGLLEQVGGILDKNEGQLLNLMNAATVLMKRLDTALQDTDMAAFLKDLETTLADARQVLVALRTVLKDPEDLRKLLDDSLVTMDEGRIVLGDVKAILGEVRKEAPSLVKKTDTLLTNADAVSVRMDTLLHAMEKAGLTDEKRLSALVTRSESLMARADSLSARADALLVKIERGEGSVGKLMKDEEVYNDLKALLAEVRQNPWRLMVPNRK